MNGNRSMMSVLAAAFLLIFTTVIVSAESGTKPRSLTIGLRGGAFAPQDQSIQGFETITYNVEGSPTSLLVSGFGPGGEVHFHVGHTQDNVKVWMLEIGGRLQRRQSEMSLVPDGQWDRYDNELTAAAASFSRIYRFPAESSKVVPYLGAGITAQLIRWETLHEPEGGARQWYRGESVVPGIIVAAGWRTPIYYDLFLDAQFRYSHCMGKMRIRNEDTGTEAEDKRMNMGGFSLLLGLSIDLKPRD